MARRQWVVFDDVKAAVSIEQVLAHRGVRFHKKASGALEAPCPLHRGENPRHFKATANGRGFKCFGCGAGGNVLDLVAALEGCSLREAALRLSDWFGLPTAKPGKLAPAGDSKRRKPRAGRAHTNDKRQSVGARRTPPRKAPPDAGSLG